MDEITWNEVICLINRIVHEIRMALSHELYLSALALALTLPDTCGKAEYPNESFKDSEIGVVFKMLKEKEEQVQSTDFNFTDTKAEIIKAFNEEIK